MQYIFHYVTENNFFLNVKEFVACSLLLSRSFFKLKVSEVHQGHYYHSNQNKQTNVPVFLAPVSACKSRKGKPF